MDKNIGSDDFSSILERLDELTRCGSEALVDKSNRSKGMIEFGQLSRLAFGCDPLGGHNWGEVDPGAIARSIPYAIDKGVTLFDTADCYGNGLSERRLGNALGSRRHEVLIATKFGVRIADDGKVFIDNDPAWIRKAVEASLRRLGTDVIDIYQLHWWDGRTPFPAIFEVLDNLIEAGKIRAYGSTNVTLEMMNLSSAEQLPAAYVSSSMEFSLVHGTNRDAIEAMCGQGGGRPQFLAWGSLGGGILSGKYTSPTDLAPTDRRLSRADSHFRGDRLHNNLAIVDVCRKIAARHGAQVKVSQVALQWIGRTLGFGSCLVGIKSQDQLDDALASWDFWMSDEDIRSLDAVAHR